MASGNLYAGLNPTEVQELPESRENASRGSILDELTGEEVDKTKDRYSEVLRCANGIKLTSENAVQYLGKYITIHDKLSNRWEGHGFLAGVQENGDLILYKNLARCQKYKTTHNGDVDLELLSTQWIKEDSDVENINMEEYNVYCKPDYELYY